MADYIRISPGQKCQRCGDDNSFRSHGTKYCFKCAKIVASENRAAKKKYLDGLVSRDTVRYTGLDKCCYKYMELDTMFCAMCGQRLKKNKEVK